MADVAQEIDQVEVYVTPDGLGRAAIVRRVDGLLSIYTHWIWASNVREAFNVAPGGRTSWLTDRTELRDLYADVEPLPGLYQALDDARVALRGMAGFAEASVLVVP